MFKWRFHSTLYVVQEYVPLNGMLQEDNINEQAEIEEGRDLTQSYDKSPYTDRKIQKAMWQHKNATKNFDYTTIADRLRTVSWGNGSHPTGVVKLVYGIPTFPITAKVV